MSAEMGRRKEAAEPMRGVGLPRRRQLAVPTADPFLHSTGAEPLQGFLAGVFKCQIASNETQWITDRRGAPGRASLAFAPSHPNG